MKMAKKLLAVVLAGVMAVSMLTGCSLSDAAKAKALETALNSTGVQHQQKVDFNHKKSLDDEANKVWTKVLGDTDVRNAKLTASKQTTEANAKFVYDVKIGGEGANDKKYAYIVVPVGDKKSEIKKSDKILGANLIYAATYKTVGTKLADDIKKADGNGDAMKIVDGNATAQGLRKVSFGVKFVDDGAENKTYYAIVVVEVTKTAA